MRFETIRKAAARRPWKSFTIVLDNGESVPVTHQENIYFLKNDEVIVYANGTSWIFEAVAVTSIDRRKKRAQST